MFSADIIHDFIDGLVAYGTHILIGLMMTGFVLGVVFRALIYHAIRREHWFALEFEKRVDQFLASSSKEKNSEEISFYATTKRLLEKCYYELFEVRAIMKRRKPDYVMSLGDRLFLVQQGCARLVKDTLKQIRHIKHNGEHPKLLEISKNVFQNNACFSRVFGIVPSSVFNDVLNILPGIFIIAGIFGTFLSITDALPMLGAMNLNDVDDARKTMDGFLNRIAFAMHTSIVGIFLSVGMTIFNTLLSPERLFLTIVNRYENCLDAIWYRSETNDLPEAEKDFDEHKDSFEALAEQALQKELAKGSKRWDSQSQEAS